VRGRETKILEAVEKYEIGGMKPRVSVLTYLSIRSQNKGIFHAQLCAFPLPCLVEHVSFYLCFVF